MSSEGEGSGGSAFLNVITKGAALIGVIGFFLVRRIVKRRKALAASEKVANQS